MVLDVAGLMRVNRGGTKMPQQFVMAYITFLSIFLGTSTSAQELAAQKEALMLIRETAADICYTIDPSSRSTEVSLSGEAAAKVNGLVGKIADIGIKGAGEYKSKEAQGVLQGDLAKAIRDSGDCRKGVFDKLVERLLPAERMRLNETKWFKAPDIDARAGDGPAGKAFAIGFSIVEIPGAQFPNYVAEWTWTGSGGSQGGSQSIIFDLKSDKGATVQSLNFPIDRSHCYYEGGHPERKEGTLRVPSTTISNVEVRTTVLEGRVGRC